MKSVVLECTSRMPCVMNRNAGSEIELRAGVFCTQSVLTNMQGSSYFSVRATERISSVSGFFRLIAETSAINFNSDTPSSWATCLNISNPLEWQPANYLQVSALVHHFGIHWKYPKNDGVDILRTLEVIHYLRPATKKLLRLGMNILAQINRHCVPPCRNYFI